MLTVVIRTPIKQQSIELVRAMEEYQEFEPTARRTQAMTNVSLNLKLNMLCAAKFKSCTAQAFPTKAPRRLTAN